MKIIQINEAESIIEPFYDGGTSDIFEKEKRYSLLEEYVISKNSHATVTVEQAWAFIKYKVENITKNEVAFELERECDIFIHEYDEFIIFAGFMKNIRFSLDAVIDGKTQKIFHDEMGVGYCYEYKKPIKGKHLQKIKLCIIATENITVGDISWFGLSNKQKLENMLNRKPAHNSEWDGYFTNPKNITFAPNIGILFNNKELENLRKKVKTPPFCNIYKKRKAQAFLDMQIQPENYIDKFVPHIDARFSRTRSKFKDIHLVMENLAFVGLIEKNYEMMRMATRHAISVSHCEYWCESPMGILPGCTWHHRSFTETYFSKAVAFVLDWCGELLTDYGKQVLRDALVMKALPRIESDFKRMEYIRHMNQGIVFSYGRIFLLLALLPKYPRYKTLLQEAKRDIVHMIDSYIQEDGGTLEGPGYWRFAFKDALSALYALAKHENQDLTYYTDVFKNTSNFELSLLSLENNQTVLLPINDCHPKLSVSSTISSCFYQLTKDENWLNIYNTLCSNDEIDEDIFSLICSPLQKQCVSALPPINRIYMKTGQVGSVRDGLDVKTHIHLCSGPTYVAHFHQDKGSLIIEADKFTLCPDLGSGYYHETNLFELCFASAHNLLLPIFPNGECGVQDGSCKGGDIIKATQQSDDVLFISDNTNAWTNEPFEYQTRTVVSPFAELIIIEDNYFLKNANKVQFLLNGFGEFQKSNTRWSFLRDNIKLTVIPLNWIPTDEQVLKIEDGEHRIGERLVLSSNAKKANLKTAILIEKNLKINIEENHKQRIFTQTNKQYILEL